MSVSDGQLANQTTFNNAFMSRTANDNTTGVKSLENADPASGASVTNPQRDINGLNTFAGRTSNDVHDSLPNWAMGEIGTGTDTLKDRAEALSAAFTVATGHNHDGSPGSGGAVSAANLDNLNYFKAQFATTSIATGTGTSTDVSSAFVGESPAGSPTTEGVITGSPFNRVQIIVDATEDAVDDPQGRRVYGELTHAAGVWTLSYFVNDGGTPAAYNFTGSEDIRIFYRKVYTLENVPTIGADVLVLPSMDATADIPDATPTVRGLVSTGTQSFDGEKTFEDNVNIDGQTRIATSITGVVKSASGVLSASDVDLATEVTGTLPVGNGGTGLTALGTSNQVLGVNNAGDANEYKSVNGTVDQITVGHAANAINLSLPQNIATTSSPQFVNQLLTGVLKTQAEEDNTSGSSVELDLPTKFHVKLTNASLVSVAMIEDPAADEQLLVLTNVTGVDVDILNLTGATAAHQIVTGAGADITLTDTASLFLLYDRGQEKWIVIGGSGGAGGANTTLSNLTSPTAVNQDLLSDSTNTRKLGANTNIWSSLYVGTIRDTLDAQSIHPGNRTLHNVGGTTVFDYSGTNLDAKTRKIVNVVDPTNDQDVATKKYVDDNVGGGGGGLIARQIFTSSGTYTKATNNPSFVIVKVVGGGGGGASANGTGTGGGGGSAGGYSEKLILASALSSSETVTVGSGGGGGADTDGASGNTSSFGAHCSATGGSGGFKVEPSPGSRGSGSGGDINAQGGGGGSGFTALPISGVGGSSALSGGGQSIFRGGSGITNGVTAILGAGGSGAARSGGGSNGTGGSGGNGIVIVEEYS